MPAAVIVFPGSNCDRDVAVALEAASGRPPAMVWHQESALPPSNLIVVPGGFSYGDYLRSGAMAAHSPIMRAVTARANAGTPVLGICNGFQILAEAGLLPGILMRNASLKFVCRDVDLRVERADTVFTSAYNQGEVLRVPVAHHDGNYFADPDTLNMLEGENRVVFRYAEGTNPNGSVNDIAGIINEAGNVLGMMPHPENLIETAHGGDEGRALFEAALKVAA